MCCQPYCFFFSSPLIYYTLYGLENNPVSHGYTHIIYIHNTHRYVSIVYIQLDREMCFVFPCIRRAHRTLSHLFPCTCVCVCVHIRESSNHQRIREREIVGEYVCASVHLFILPFRKHWTMGELTSKPIHFISTHNNRKNRL